MSVEGAVPSRFAQGAAKKESRTGGVREGVSFGGVSVKDSPSILPYFFGSNMVIADDEQDTRLNLALA